MSLRTPMVRVSILTRSLFSSRIFEARRRAAGDLVNLGFSTPDPSAPETAPEKFIWTPVPHAFAGSDRMTCTARVEDTRGFSGTCGHRYSSQVHTDPGGPVAAGITKDALADTSQAEPGDHVSHRQLEDFLKLYGKLDRVEAQRIAHIVCTEYDLFPKGLLLIHKGLDAS